MLNRWAFILNEYDFTINHRPGKHMILEDSLSQLYPAEMWTEQGLQKPEIRPEDKFDTAKRGKLKGSATKAKLGRLLVNDPEKASRKLRTLQKLSKEIYEKELVENEND